ncbi:MAG: hypothetical protein IJM79_04300 [Erysipelotrichaceae bacterium]|nr:hypothetical protein [Erysipelotrichaceae bacterium]
MILFFIIMIVLMNRARYWGCRGPRFYRRPMFFGPGFFGPRMHMGHRGPGFRRPPMGRWGF